MIRSVNEAWQKGSLHALFSDLFFKRQDLPLLKICDYLDNVYFEHGGKKSAELLKTHLSLFAQSFKDSEDFAEIAEEQAVFVHFINMYLQAKQDAEDRLQKGSEVTVTRIIRHTAAGLEPSEIPQMRKNWEEMIRNTAAVAPHSLLQLIESMLEYHQQKIMTLIQQEIINKRNQSLGNDPF